MAQLPPIVEPPPPAALSPRIRWAAAAAAGVLVALLVVAAGVVPDSRGHGTHEQLGLSPCRFRSLTDYPCPTCGMTTAWALLVRGRVPQALQANAAGAVLAATAAAAAVWLLLSALRGRWLAASPRLESIVYAGTLWLALVAFDWVRRLADGG